MAKTEITYVLPQKIMAKMLYPGFAFIAFVATRKPRRRR